MQTLRARLTPRSAFGTLPVGDTLFGQVCWALRNRFGDGRLEILLEGYTQGRPFLVVSDAMPSNLFAQADGLNRKEAKKRQWLPLEKSSELLADWLRFCVTSADLSGGWFETHPQSHNSIDRRIGTTGGDFAPYSMPQHWPGQQGKENGKECFIVSAMDVYLVLEETLLSEDEVKAVFSDIGELGFGRDASVGLGRFTLDALEKTSLPMQREANAWVTLAPCSPQGLQLAPAWCFYQVFTRFGHHGDAAVQWGNPFKTPVLLAATGALLTPAKFEPKLFIGHGLGGDGKLSKVLPQTVQQGYAPVVGVKFDQSVGAA